MNVWEVLLQAGAPPEVIRRLMESLKPKAPIFRQRPGSVIRQATQGPPTRSGIVRHQTSPQQSTRFRY